MDNPPLDFSYVTDAWRRQLEREARDVVRQVLGEWKTKGRGPLGEEWPDEPEEGLPEQRGQQGGQYPGEQPGRDQVDPGGGHAERGQPEQHGGEDQEHEHDGVHPHLMPGEVDRHA